MRRIEKIQKDFIWHGLKVRKWVHLVKLKGMCRPIVEGALWIKQIKKINIAFLGSGLGESGLRRILIGKNV